MNELEVVRVCSACHHGAEMHAEPAGTPPHDDTYAVASLEALSRGMGCIEMDGDRYCPCTRSAIRASSGWELAPA